MSATEVPSDITEETNKFEEFLSSRDGKIVTIIALCVALVLVVSWNLYFLLQATLIFNFDHKLIMFLYILFPMHVNENDSIYVLFLVVVVVVFIQFVARFVK